MLALVIGDLVPDAELCIVQYANNRIEADQGELLSRNTFETKDQARRAVAGFIDVYNTRRRHSSCEMLPPVAYEQLLAERAAASHDEQDRAA